MKGHIRERSPGKWAIVVDIRDPATGKRRRKWHTFHGTKRQAETECSRLVAEISGGVYIEPDKTTLGDFLGRWLEHIRPAVSPKTQERYAELCQKTLPADLAAIPLSKLRTERVDAALTELLSTGRRDGKGGLSARTVHHARRVLIKALNQAVTWQLIRQNPAIASQAPKITRVGVEAYSPAQTAELIETMRPTRLFVPVLLAVTCGLRRGEIAALRWRDIDFEACELSVSRSAEQTVDGIRYKEPKSGKARTVALSRTMVEELKAHRARQAEEQLRLGLRLSENSFLVAQFDGSPLQPRSITHEWMRLIKKTALPRIRFHDLRHTHATQMLAAGVHPKIASERLGHSTIGITLDLYSHVMPGMQADAAERVDEALQQAIKGRD